MEVRFEPNLPVPSALAFGREETFGGGIPDSAGPPPPPPGGAEVAGPGLLGRFLDLFIAPSRVFVAPRSSSLWWIALLLISLLHVVDAVWLHDLYDAVQLEKTEQFLNRNERIPAAEKAKMLQDIEDRSGTVKGIVTAAGARVVAVALVGVFLPAGLLLFGVNFVFAGRARFIDVLTVTTFSQLVTLPRDLILIPLRRMTNQLEIYAGPAALVSSDSGLLQPFLMLFDVFDIYHLLPFALGLALVSGIARPKAWGLVITVWSIWAAIALGFSWIAIKMGMN